MATVAKPVEDLEVGDVISHRITAIDPYTQPTMPEAFAIAHSGPHWRITLCQGTTLDVLS
jgi:hypothetical protein